MSSKHDEPSIDAIGHMIMRWQDASEAFDEAFGRRHDLSGPERRCLGLVAFGPQTPRAIADATSLTPAAITALLDRLEARDLLTRKPDPDDRRKVIVEATGKTQRLIKQAYGRIQQEGALLLQRYPASDRAIIHGFLADAVELQRRITREFLMK
jgi:DNA-binding MarR family transcriptional regulator